MKGNVQYRNTHIYIYIYIYKAYDYQLRLFLIKQQFLINTCISHDLGLKNPDFH